jgi:hypothetical protein
MSLIDLQVQCRAIEVKKTQTHTKIEETFPNPEFLAVVKADPVREVRRVFAFLVNLFFTTL